MRYTCSSSASTLLRCLTRSSTRLRCRQDTPVFALRRCYAGAGKVDRNEDVRQVIFSGMQPSGIPHLGNLMGAILPWVKLQNSAPPDTRLLFSIVDLHALTSPASASARRIHRRQLLATFVAAGLDPKRCVLFYQSDVPQHSELHWILSATAPVSELARMTQWKSKLGEQDAAELLIQSPNPDKRERMKLGLFSYPVLQAADILVHQATHVPVGADQRQHVEFARECAKMFNHTYRLSDRYTLPLPQVVVSDAARIMSLTEPDKKMSKSHASARSRILITDEEDLVRTKIKHAVTDSQGTVSYDPHVRPGVSNLIDIAALLETRTTDDIVAQYSTQQGVTLGHFKEHVAETICRLLRPIRSRYQDLIDRPEKLDAIARDGAEQARKSATATMEHVHAAVGLRE